MPLELKVIREEPVVQEPLVLKVLTELETLEPLEPLELKENQE